jgi:restriction system protein
MGRARGKDGGIDITAHLSDILHGGKFLFQCKRYQEQTRIGRPVLQEFCGAAHSHRQHPRLVFITTSGYSREAIDYAGSVGIRLIDFAEFAQLLADNHVL